jgi:tetratricopeptide (TPR) repeat protein
MFRLLGLTTGPDVSIAAAASLAGISRDQAVRALDELTGAGLAERRQAHRYALHDLLCLFAVERAEAEETAQARADAVDRLLWCYLQSADAADRVILPRSLHVPLEPDEALPVSVSFAGDGGSDGHAKAMEWFDSERANLVAAIQQAAGAGRDMMAWKIPAAMWGYFYLRKPWTDWILSHEAGLAAARRSEDLYGQAWMLYSLGTAHWSQGQHEQAIEYYEASLAAWGVMSHRWGEAMTLNNLAAARAGVGQRREALRVFRQALRIRSQIGDTRGRIQTIINIGRLHSELEQFAPAERHLQEGLELSRQVGYTYGEATTLHNLGLVSDGLGQPGKALRYLNESVDLRRELGDQQGEAECLHLIGQLERAAGNDDRARDSWLRALRIFETLNDPQATSVRRSLRDLAP